MPGGDQEERGQARPARREVRAAELQPGQGGGRVAQDLGQLLPRLPDPPHGARDQPELQRVSRHRDGHRHVLRVHAGRGGDGGR